MAKSPGGKSVGRVSIRVVPDSSRFQADLKKSLERIEKRTVLNIPLAIETRQAEVDLKKFQKKWNGEEVAFDVDAKTAGATAHMREATRPRSVPVTVDVKKASLAKAQTLIASLSGARLTGDLVKNISTRLQNLDRSLPKLAMVGLAVANIGSLALSSVGGIATLASSLAALTALAAPLPGVLAGVAVGAGVFVVALKDAKKELSALTPAWKSLGDEISQNYWAKAQKPILTMVNSVMPQLRASLGETATEIGSWSASVADGFRKAFSGDVLSSMIGKLNESIKIASGGTGEFAHAIAQLGTFGSQYLPLLASWFSKITSEFDTWITKVASDGSLKKWVSEGLDAARQLGSVLGSALRIIDGVAKAAEAAGGGGLTTFAAVFKTIADTINSPTFQTVLTTLFQGAAAGVSGLAAALQPIGSMLQTLAPVLKQVLASSGTVLGGILGQIATALSQPAFANGLSDFFGGIENGIEAIGPALPAIATAFGAIGSFAGTLAAAIGPVLGAALQVLAPLLTQVLNAVAPLIPMLGGLLVQAIRVVGPLLQAMVPAFVSLIPAVQTVLAALQPLIAGVLPSLMSYVQSIMPIFMQLAPILAQVAAALLPIVASLLPPLVSLIQAFLPVISAVLVPLLGMIAPLLQLVGPILGPLISLLAVLLKSALQPFLVTMSALMPILGGVASAIGDVLAPVIGGLKKVLGGLIDFLTGVFTGNWKKAWNGIVQIFSGIWDGISGLAKGSLNGLIDIVNGMINGVNKVTGIVGIPKIPDIPKLATGGDVEPQPGGTVVRLAEAGQAETVTNRGLTNRMLEATTRLANQAIGGSSSGGSGVVQNIYPREGMSEETIGTVAANELNYLMRSPA